MFEVSFYNVNFSLLHIHWHLIFPSVLSRGIMLFEDETCYEGNFADAGVFSGQGCLMCANGDRLEGAFFGNYTDGMKFNGTIYKSRGGAGEVAGGGGGGLVRQVLKEKSIKLFISIRRKCVFFSS